MEWKPIETAPKDGTKFLSYEKAWNEYIVCYWDRSSFMAISIDQFGCNEPVEPTHWMPLPTPPENKN